MHELVKDYYGRQLRGSDDLKTNACCDSTGAPDWLAALLAEVHPQVQQRYYGCGLVAPALLDGCRILDLGCGAGRDCYLLAQLAGPTGAVLGVDMTEQQLATAERFRAWHTQRFGYDNVEFRLGYIEQLDALGLTDASFDVIVSNCVLNLSPRKDRVLAEAFRLLRPGGELYFADVYADRRLPEALRNDPVLYGECLGGALYWNDFLQLARAAGFTDPRLVQDRPLAVDDEVRKRTGDARFHSATFRLFKLDGLEPACEDYGHALRYRGGIAHAESALPLDRNHVFEAGAVVPVCGNTWRMITATRFAPWFDRVNEGGAHRGIFPACGTAAPAPASARSAPRTCCA